MANEFKNYKVIVYRALAPLHGGKSLVVGEGYSLCRDRHPHNTAIAIVSRASGQKKASLKQNWTAIIASIFDGGLVRN